MVDKINNHRNYSVETMRNCTMDLNKGLWDYTYPTSIESTYCPHAFIYNTLKGFSFTTIGKIVSLRIIYVNTLVDGMNCRFVYVQRVYGVGVLESKD